MLLLDNDTIRSWYQLYQEDGIEGLASFGHEGGACRLTAQQQAWISETLPLTTRAVGAWIARECGVEYQTRSGLIALLHRLGMEHCKPTAISRKLDPVKQASFIKAHHALMNQLSADEAVVFADAVDPTHGTDGHFTTPNRRSIGRRRSNMPVTASVNTRIISVGSLIAWPSR